MKKAITLVVRKDDVLEEVSKTTAYEGAKAVRAEEDVYGRVATTRADEEMLERFWQEARTGALGAVAEYTDEATADGDDMELRLLMPGTYNTAMTGAAEKMLRSFAVNYVVSKWFAMANKDSAESYAMLAAASLKDVKAKLDERVRPARPVRHMPCED